MFPHLAFTTAHGAEVPVSPRVRTADAGTHLWIGGPAPEPDPPRDAQEVDLRSRWEPVAFSVPLEGAPPYWVLLTPREDSLFEIRYHGASEEVAVVTDRVGHETKLRWGHGCRDDGRPVPSFYRDAEAAEVDGYADIVIGDVLLTVRTGEESEAAGDYEDPGEDNLGGQDLTTAHNSFASLSVATGLTFPQIQLLVVDAALDCLAPTMRAPLTSSERYQLHRVAGASSQSGYDPGETQQAWSRRRQRALATLATSTADSIGPYRPGDSPGQWLSNQGFDLGVLDPTLYDAALAAGRSDEIAQDDPATLPSAVAPNNVEETELRSDEPELRSDEANSHSGGSTLAMRTAPEPPVRNGDQEAHYDHVRQVLRRVAQEQAAAERLA